MRLVALMSWYEEPAAWLSAAISSLTKLGIDHLIAVDGAYFLLPEGRPRSGTEQHAAILETCHALDLGVTIHTPQERWYGNEVEKRSFLFTAGDLITEPDDWYVVMDADQIITEVQCDVKATLDNLTEDACTVTFWERHIPDSTAAQRKVAQQFTWQRDSNTPVRIFFRAIPGIQVVGNHFTYVTPDGRTLWGNNRQDTVVEAHHLPIKVEHRTWLRDKARHDQQYAYYRKRDELGTERPKCAWCDEDSVKTIPWEWERLHTTGDLAAGWLEVCATHEADAWKQSEQQLTDLGVDVKAMYEQAKAEGRPMLTLAQGKVPA